MENSTFENFETNQVMQIMNLVTSGVHIIFILHFKEKFQG
jgi:hypothetical protein